MSRTYKTDPPAVQLARRVNRPLSAAEYDVLRQRLWTTDWAKAPNAQHSLDHEVKWRLAQCERDEGKERRRRERAQARDAIRNARYEALLDRPRRRW